MSNKNYESHRKAIVSKGRNYFTARDINSFQ